MKYPDMRNAVRLSIKKAGLPYDEDRMQEGLLHLLRKMPSWSPDGGASEFSYALIWLRSLWSSEKARYASDRTIAMDDPPHPPDNRYPGRDATQLELKDVLKGVPLSATQRETLDLILSGTDPVRARKSLGITPQAWHSRRTGLVQKIQRFMEVNENGERSAEFRERPVVHSRVRLVRRPPGARRRVRPGPGLRRVRQHEGAGDQILLREGSGAGVAC